MGGHRSGKRKRMGKRKREGGEEENIQLEQREREQGEREEKNGKGRYFGSCEKN
jgi:hypothetical protein